MAQLNLNTDNIPVADRYGPVPEGDYRMIVEATDIKQNKAGNGSYLEAILVVIEGEYKGRKVWSRMTITHDTSEKAVAFGKRMVGDLSLACGKRSIQDTQELHGIPIKVALKISKQAGYDPSNEVRKFHIPGPGNVPEHLQQSVEQHAVQDDPFGGPDGGFGDTDTNTWP